MGPLFFRTLGLVWHGYGHLGLEIELNVNCLSIGMVKLYFGAVFSNCPLGFVFVFGGPTRIGRGVSTSKVYIGLWWPYEWL